MKQVILVRKDLKLSKGKLASQCSHASVEAVLKSNKEKVDEWRKFSKKVILKVKDEKELLNFKRLADKEKLVNALIKDAGRTEIPPGTITCLAIGPDDDKKIDKVTGKLKIL
jgi:PTH2 family peptidyl-tRNA hydrolase